MTVAVHSAFVLNCKTAWDYTLDALGRKDGRRYKVPSVNAREPRLSGIVKESKPIAAAGRDVADR